RTELSGDSSDGGDFEYDGNGAWVYGSWLLGDRGFIDASVGVDAQDRRIRRLVGITTVTVTPNRTLVTIDPPIEAVQGDTRSREKGFDLSGGYGFFVGSVTIGPRIGLAKRRVGVGSFIESGATPMALAFDRQTIRSERTSLGVQISKALSLEKGVLVTQFNVDWLHEREDDQRLITARFAEDFRPDAPKLSFLNQPPDRDWLDLRVSVVRVFPRGLSAFLSIEGTSGHDYVDRYGASAGFRREF